MKWLLSTLVLVLSGTALSDTHWAQIPGQPVWVAVPSQWTVVGSPDRAAITATFPRGGVVTFVVAAAEGLDLSTAHEWETLSAGYRGVSAPTIDVKGFHGKGRVGEALFALDVAQKALDMSTLVAVPPSALLVARAIPASVAKDLAASVPEMVASVRVQWERPGGEWTTVPGSGVEIQEPLAGFQTSVSGAGVFVRARDGSIEVQAVFRAKATDVKKIVSSYQQVVDPGGFAWAVAPVAIKSIGASKGALRASGKGVVEGDTYMTEVVGAPVAGGVLVLIQSSVGKAGAPVPAFPDLAGMLRLAR